MKPVSIGNIDYYDSIQVAKKINQTHQNFKKKFSKVGFEPKSINGWEGSGLPIPKEVLVNIMDTYDVNVLQNGNRTAIENAKRHLKGMTPEVPREVVMLQQNNAALSRQVNELNSKNDRLNSRNNRLNQEKNELNSKVNELNSKLSQLNSGSSQLNSTVGQLNSENSQLNSKVNELNSKNEQLNSEAIELNLKISELNSLRSEFNRERDELNATNSQLNANNTTQLLQIEKLKAVVTEWEQKQSEIISDHKQLTWGRNPIHIMLNLVIMIVNPLIAFFHRREFLFAVVGFLIFVQGHQISNLLKISRNDEGEDMTMMVMAFGILFEIIPLVMIVNHKSKYWIYAFAVFAGVINACYFFDFTPFWHKAIITVAIPFAMASFIELFKDKT